MLPIRCTVIDFGVLGGGLRLDEKPCLQYLSDLHQFLVKNKEQQELSESGVCGSEENPEAYRSSSLDVESNRGINRRPSLCITRKEWIEFGTRSTSSSSILNTLLSENEIEALWTLFATLIIVEGVSIPTASVVHNHQSSQQEELTSLTQFGTSQPSTTKQLNNDTNNCSQKIDDLQFSPFLDPQSIAIDFRHFGLLLFLQTKKGTSASRNQLYHRLLRASNNEVVYSNPAAAAAAYQHAAQVTGGLVSPRSTPRHASFSLNHSQPSSLLLTSVSALISPRENHTISTAPLSSSIHHFTPQTPADDFKQFIISNLNTLLRIVHYEYLDDVEIIDRSCIDKLDIYVDLPVGNQSISSFIEIPQQGNRPRATTGPTPSAISSVEQRLATSLSIHPSNHPILCRTTPSPTLSGLIASTSSTTIPPQYSPSRKTSFASPTATPSSSHHRSFNSTSHRDPSSANAATICIEGARRETIIRGYEDQLLIKSHHRRTSGSTSVVYQEKVFDGHLDTTGLELDAGHRSSSLPTRQEMRLQNRSGEFDSRRGEKTSTLLKRFVPNVYLAELSECTIYLLRPVRYVRIQSCKDCTIVIPSSSGICALTGCSNINVHATARCFKIENCYETTLHIFSFTPPIIIGDTRGLKIGPYACLFSQQRQMMAAQSLQFLPAFVARWASPIILGGRYANRSHNIGSSSTSGSQQQAARTASATGSTKESTTSTPASSSTESLSGIHGASNRPQASLSSSSLASSMIGAMTTLRTSTGPVDETSILGMYSLIAPEDFKTLIIPEIAKHTSTQHGVSSASPSQTASNSHSKISGHDRHQLTLMLPQIYADALRQQQLRSAEMINAMHQLASSSPSDTAATVTKALHMHFVSWLQQTGHVRELTELAKAEMVLMKNSSNTNNHSKHKQMNSPSHNIVSPLNVTSNSRSAVKSPSTFKSINRP